MPKYCYKGKIYNSGDMVKIEGRLGQDNNKGSHCLYVFGHEAEPHWVESKWRTYILTSIT
jgi:hypothetical protein